MENVFGSFCRKMENIFSSFCRKMENVLAVFVGKWKMFWLFPYHNARHNNFKQA